MENVPNMKKVHIKISLFAGIVDETKSNCNILLRRQSLWWIIIDEIFFFV